MRLYHLIEEQKSSGWRSNLALTLVGGYPGTLTRDDKVKIPMCQYNTCNCTTIQMERLSQLTSHVAPDTIRSSASRATITPHRTGDGDTITNMAQPKVVVTRQLIDEAQRLLDEKKDKLDIVQWNSEKVLGMPFHYTNNV
jgi:hypothetical protein